MFASSFRSQSFKTKPDHRLIDLVSLVALVVCNIADVSWESSQLPQPLQLPPLALPRPHPAFKPCNLGNCYSYRRAMYWCFKALRSSPCQVLFGIKQLHSVPRGSPMTMRIFKPFPKTGCGIKCFAERKSNTVYFKETDYYPKKIFTLNIYQTIS